MNNLKSSSIWPSADTAGCSAILRCLAAAPIILVSRFGHNAGARLLPESFNDLRAAAKSTQGCASGAMQGTQRQRWQSETNGRCAGQQVGPSGAGGSGGTHRQPAGASRSGPCAA